MLKMAKPVTKEKVLETMVLEMYETFDDCLGSALLNVLDQR